jgi:hypothetical protein
MTTHRMSVSRQQPDATDSIAKSFHGREHLATGWSEHVDSLQTCSLLIEGTNHERHDHFSRWRFSATDSTD